MRWRDGLERGGRSRRRSASRPSSWPLRTARRRLPRLRPTRRRAHRCPLCRTRARPIPRFATWPGTRERPSTSLRARRCSTCATGKGGRTGAPLPGREHLAPDRPRAPRRRSCELHHALRAPNEHSYLRPAALSRAVAGNRHGARAARAGRLKYEFLVRPGADPSDHPARLSPAPMGSPSPAARSLEVATPLGNAARCRAQSSSQGARARRQPLRDLRYLIRLRGRRLRPLAPAADRPGPRILDLRGRSAESRTPTTSRSTDPATRT